MNRMEEEKLPKKCCKWIPQRWKKRGRPKTCWKDEEKAAIKTIIKRNIEKYLDE